MFKTCEQKYFIEADGNSATGERRSNFCGSHSFPIQWNSIWNLIDKHSENVATKICAVRSIFCNFTAYETLVHLHGSSILLLLIEILLFQQEYTTIFVEKTIEDSSHCFVNFGDFFRTVCQTHSTGKNSAAE